MKQKKQENILLFLFLPVALMLGKNRTNAFW
jgi:hypothetical protein